MGNAPRVRELCGIQRSSLLRSCCKNKFKKPEKLPHLCASDDERRQQTQRKVVSTVDQQPALHGLGDERPAFDGEFDADHQAFTANFADEAEFGCEPCEAVAELSTARADIFEELLVLNDLEKFQGHGASQRAAAESGAMHPGRNARGNLLRGKNGSK